MHASEKIQSTVSELLTLVVVGRNSGFINHQTSGLVRVGHDAVASSQNRSDIQTSNPLIRNGIERCFNSCKSYGKENQRIHRFRLECRFAP